MWLKDRQIRTDFPVSRKGISQVASSALLLVVVISVAGIYSNWAPGFSEDAASNVADQSNNDIKCRNVGFNIEKAAYDQSAAHTIVKVKNTGTINLYKDIRITSLNSSKVIGKRVLDELEVDETIRTTIDSQKIPDKIIISSQECPGSTITVEDIDTQD